MCGARMISDVCSSDLLLLIFLFFFFKQKTAYEIGTGDWSSDVCSSDLTISRCGSAPAIFTDHFSLRQRPRFLYCPFLVAAAPRFFYCPFLIAASPSFYTVHFSLRQRPCILYCPFLIAAAPALFILNNSRCGSAPAFYTADRKSVV